MQIENLYNNVLLKSRNINLFKNCYIDDTLENKIILFIIYFSFIFNKLKKKKPKKINYYLIIFLIESRAIYENWD